MMIISDKLILMFYSTSRNRCVLLLVYFVKFKLYTQSEIFLQRTCGVSHAVMSPNASWSVAGNRVAF
jgi:hypothetical protein